MYRQLYIFVEGDDDERFVDRILRPILNERYDYIGCYKYAQRSKSKVEKFVRSIAAREIDFFCLVDIDSSPCITNRKEMARDTKFGDVEYGRIAVVRMEIESWYLAGLSDESCQRLHISSYDQTDSICKEGCEKILDKSKLGYTANCKIEILKNYNLTTARSKNISFDHFYRKHLLHSHTLY